MQPSRSTAPLVPAMLFLAATGCGASSCDEPGRPSAVRRDVAERVALSTLPFAELDVPPTSRRPEQPVSAQIPIEGPFTVEGAQKKSGKTRYVADLQIRPRGMFFARPQGGVELRTKDGALVPYDRTGQADGVTWGYDLRRLTLFAPEGAAPQPGDYVLVAQSAVDRERALNHELSGEPREAFVWAEVTDGWDTRNGLLLPAPGRAAWDLPVPPAAELTFTAGLVEPEIRNGAPSDGATLVVEVEAGGATSEVYREAVTPRAFADRRVDLSRWAGQQVRLRFRTEPGADATYDYVFAGSPLVTSRTRAPTRVVLVYLDTLRPDHMSLYGYDRDTSLPLDAWAEDAAVFTAARSVAPWTLPSARTLVTGRQPEEYTEARTLPGLLHDRGWATTMVAGNVYLMSTFHMQRDWDLHRIDTWPPANQVTDAAIAAIAAHDGHDALIQAQYMSVHLPYVEPEPYLHLYAGDIVRPLRKGFLVEDVRKADGPKHPEVRQYVADRYDNNVRFLADEVKRLIDTLDDDDFVFIFADHGEELWDHDGFEHGHTLYDEVLRVPLIIAGPGIRGARIDAPVSLLDVAPTILDLLGEPIPPEMDGRSLAPLLRGDAGAEGPFLERDQAFGRPLYGLERWGVLHRDQKWSVFQDNRQLFDLAADPGEHKNLLRKDPDAGEPFPSYLSAALGRPVVRALRWVDTRGDEPVWMLCSAPGGFSEAFVGTDPLENSAATVIRLPADEAQAQLQRYGVPVGDHRVQDEAAEVCWARGVREVYLLPKAGVEAPVVCSARVGDATGTVETASSVRKLQLGARAISWSEGIAPVPSPSATPLSGRNDESIQELVALGYLTAAQAEHAATSGCAPPEER